jgi:2,4-dienoyl-CoA reductase-like NADH-dependent reductase (Old Yellow Enzyme family)
LGGKDEVLESFKGIDTTDTPAIVSSIAELIRRFDRQEFDLVAVGRASIGDPDWVNKVAAGRYQDIRRFNLKDLLTVLAAYDTEFNKGLYG